LDRAHGASAAKARCKAEPDSETHVGAPMPFVVSALAVPSERAEKAGDQIDAKDLLIALG
jgi:pyruvate carboxylase